MLTLDNISFEFGGRFLFKEATLQVMPGDRIGLIGRNGTGKTTLLRVIAGEYSPGTGKVAFAKNTRLGYLHQELLSYSSGKSAYGVAMEAFDDVLAIKKDMDALLAEMEIEVTDAKLHKLHDLQHEFEINDGYNLESKVLSVLVGLGFTKGMIEGPYTNLSGGWRMRVLLAKILLQRPDLLLLDEPTNHLDLPSIEWLEDYLSAFQGACIIVSHDRHFLDRLITSTVEIGNQKFNHFKGNYTYYLVEREERRALQQRQFENQQKEIDHTEKFINRFRAKASKAKQVQSRVKSLDRLDKIDAPEKDAASVNFSFKLKTKPGKTIFSMEVKSKKYGELEILKNSKTEVLRGDKIALIGANGLGKSTLLRMIAGMEPFTGSITPGHNVHTSFFAQHQSEALREKDSIIEEMKPFIAQKGETFVRNVLGGFLFSGEDVDKKIGVLSGGEKARVSLAKTLLSDANFLLLDEPTNHLDIGSIQILIQALNDYEGTFIAVSHDRYFLEKVANKIWFISNLQLEEYPGTYNEWLYHEARKKEEENPTLVPQKTQKQTAVSIKEEPKKDFHKSRESQKNKGRLESQLKKIEAEIETIEKEKSVLETEMLSPAIASNYARIGELQNDLFALEKVLNQKMEAWEKTEEALLELSKASS